MGVSIASSDLVSTAAAGQRAADKESVEDFKKAVFEVWAIKYAFFADMGSAEIYPPYSVIFPFPLHCKTAPLPCHQEPYIFPISSQNVTVQVDPRAADWH